jgi:hypothetical protein
MGRYPASVLMSTDGKRNYRAVASEVIRRAADFARAAGIDVVSVDVRRLYPPELNREHVFERMKAERAKIAKENRSAVVEAKGSSPRPTTKSASTPTLPDRYERIKAGPTPVRGPMLQPSGRTGSTNSSGPCGPTTSCWMTRRLSSFPQTPTLCGCCTSTSNRARSDRPSRPENFQPRRSSLTKKREEEEVR